MAFDPLSSHPSLSRPTALRLYVSDKKQTQVAAFNLKPALNNG